MGNSRNDNEQDFLNLCAGQKCNPAVYYRALSLDVGFMVKAFIRRHPHRLKIEWFRQPGGADSDDPAVATVGLAGREQCQHERTFNLR